MGTGPSGARMGRAEEKEERAGGRGRSRPVLGCLRPRAIREKRNLFSILFPDSNPNANPIKFEHGLKYIFLFK